MMRLSSCLGCLLDPLAEGPLAAAGLFILCLSFELDGSKLLRLRENP